MRGKGEKGATGLRSSARVRPVYCRSPVWVSQKAGQSYQGTIWGSSSQAPAAGELPAPAAVRRGWGGQAGGRAAPAGDRLEPGPAAGGAAGGVAPTRAGAGPERPWAEAGSFLELR